MSLNVRVSQTPAKERGKVTVVGGTRPARTFMFGVSTPVAVGYSYRRLRKDSGQM